MADDGEQYWVKPLNNLQFDRVCVSELIVGKLAALINAPVCGTELIEIPTALAGWGFCRYRTLEPGIAVASRHVRDAQEYRELTFAERDDNRRRIARLAALYSWTLGDDGQWLYAATKDNTVFSHDHGFYLPDGTWDADALADQVGSSHLPSCLEPGDGKIDSVEAAMIEEVLRSLSSADIAAAVLATPAVWPCSDEQLAAIGHLLDQRRFTAADDLEWLRACG